MRWTTEPSRRNRKADACASLVHGHIRPPSAYSDAARDVEGKAHSPRQPGDRLEARNTDRRFIGKAEVTSDLAVPRQIVEDYPRYLMARLGLHRPTQEMFDKGQIFPITITPVRDLPEGFSSKPGTPAPSIDGGHKPSQRGQTKPQHALLMG